VDKDRVKGKVSDIGGRIKRQAGEWTGDKELESEGTADQVKGKAQNVVGKVKDAGRNAIRDIRGKGKDEEVIKDEDRPRKRRVA
jgi:uncharacterized protein YjbJ (UPF0337 family)